jgi:hypothetical protein
MRAVRIATVIGLGLILYAYWATGLRSFTVASYIAVGIPIVIVGSIVIIGSVAAVTEAVPLSRTLPWLLLAFIAAVLEAVGVALGGRSKAVPTLSTVVDHALAWHAVRLVLFCGWLLLGLLPVISRVRGQSR